MNNKISDPLVSYLGDVECYVCHNFWHMAKHCKLSRLFRIFNQKEKQSQSTHGRKKKESSQGKKHITTKWMKKERQLFKEEKLRKCGITIFSHDEDDKWYIEKKISHHMLGYRRKIIFPKITKSGHVVFEGN